MASRQTDSEVEYSMSGDPDAVRTASGRRVVVVVQSAVEIQVVGEDDQPLEGVAVALRRDDDLESTGITNKLGLARFDALQPKRKYRFCLYRRDKDAWELVTTTKAETDPKARSKKSEWAMSSTAKTAGEQTHIVKQGDCISSIADSYGFFPDTLWDHAANKELKEKRMDPQVLMPGDEVRIPDMRQKEVEAGIGKRYTVKTKGVPEKLKIRFEIDGEPRKNEEFKIALDGRVIEGKTDADGLVDVWIPPRAKEGLLCFPGTGDEYMLSLGSLDPIDEVSGIQGRLKSMGFYDGPIDGQLSADLRRAIRIFQRDCLQETTGKIPTGELDDDTSNAIQEEFEKASRTDVSAES